MKACYFQDIFVIFGHMCLISGRNG